MSQPFEQNLSTEDIVVLEWLRTRMMPLRNNIDLLRQAVTPTHPKAPPKIPSWPEIQRQITLLNNYILSLHKYINGSTTEVTNDGVKHNDVAIPKAPILRSLHPYPTPPFSAEPYQGLIDVLLRQRISPEAENWVLERLQRAKEFCDIPEDWGIESRKRGDADDSNEGQDDEIDDESDEEAKQFKVKRRKAVLTEEDFKDLWTDASRQAGIAAAKLGSEEFDGAEDEGESGDEDEEEDVEMNDDKAVVTQNGVGAVPGTTGPGAGTGVIHAQAPLPLDALLKFMSTGSTDSA